MNEGDWRIWYTEQGEKLAAHRVDSAYMQNAISRQGVRRVSSNKKTYGPSSSVRRMYCDRMYWWYIEGLEE